MIPPSFKDLGKGAKDLFEKNFVHGLIKAEHKSKTPNGTTIKNTLTHNNDTGKVMCSVESSHKTYKDTSCTIKWNTNNVLTGSVDVEDKVLQGLKQTLELTLEVASGKKNASLKNCYKRDMVHCNVDIDCPAGLPAIGFSSVVGYNNYVGGVQLGFDSGKQELSKFNYAMGYVCKDFAFNGTVNNHMQDFGFSVYQKIYDSLESALQVVWNREKSTTNYALALKYGLSSERDDFMKLSVDNLLQVALAASFVVTDNLQLTIGAQLDGKSINSGGHKLGLGIEFNG